MPPGGIALDDRTLRKIVEEARTITVLGCSDKPYRTSYQIAEYLQKAGYRIVPVNPEIEETLGEKSYGSMGELPPGLEIDLVDIFRNKKYTLEMVLQVIDWVGLANRSPVIWTQLDVSTDEAREASESAGLVYVENRCLFSEHRRLLGGIK